MLELAAIGFHDAVVAEYRKAVAATGSADRHADRQDAFSRAYLAIADRIHAGELEIPLEDAVHAALLAADSREGAAADKILTRLVNGQIGLDVWPDPLLDVVVTLGAGRRKVWRHVTADDLNSMVELRKDNTRAARRSERRFIKDVASIYGDLVSAGTIGAMVEAARTESLSA